MAKAPESKATSQRQRFIEAAADVAASESGDDFDRALGGLAKAPPPESNRKRKKQHASDCSVHNAPALPAGECDCDED